MKIRCSCKVGRTRSGGESGLVGNTSDITQPAAHINTKTDTKINKPCQGRLGTNSSFSGGMADEEIYLPPPGPPPMLSADQIKQLCFQGWLPIQLSEELTGAVQDLSREANNFFELDIEEKEKLYPQSFGTECGYYAVSDEKEYLTLRRETHPKSQVEIKARQVWHEAGHNLLHRILCDLSRAGGYALHCWDHLVERSLDLPSADIELNDVDVTSLMRLFRYQPTSGIAAEHVDIGMLTLCVGSGKGLQVLDQSKQPPEWVDAEGPTVLIGDTVRSLFRNQVRAGVHRVVGNPQGRSSIVFALRPCLRHPTDRSMFGGSGVVDTREAYFQIKRSKYNINATKEIREKELRELKEKEESKSLSQTQQIDGNYGQG